MKNPSIKLVVSDMDGTLLDSRGNVPKQFSELFGRMHRNGITFVAASGRQIHNMKLKFQDMLDDIYFVAENGAYVTHGREELLELPLDHDDVKNFREVARGIRDAFIVLSSKRYAYIEKCDPDFLEKLRSYSGHLKDVDDVSKITDDTFFKFTLCDLKNPQTNSLPHFVRFRDRFQVETSGTKWMDITRMEANKGNAVKLIQERLGISPEETVVFGDYSNDREMLKNTPNSFAMANAIDEIKAVSKHLAPSNEEGGVAVVLDRILPR